MHSADGLRWVNSWICKHEDIEPNKKPVTGPPANNEALWLPSLPMISNETLRLQALALGIETSHTPITKDLSFWVTDIWILQSPVCGLTVFPLPAKGV